MCTFNAIATQDAFEQELNLQSKGDADDDLVGKLTCVPPNHECILLDFIVMNFEEFLGILRNA